MHWIDKIKIVCDATDEQELTFIHVNGEVRLYAFISLICRAL